MAVIVGGAAVVAVVALYRCLRTGDLAHAYVRLRQGLGKAILLGLELLVGADIIRTVAEVPTLYGVATLGGIVLIRTFLSFTLDVELEGRWPWQHRARPGD